MIQLLVPNISHGNNNTHLFTGHYGVSIIREY